MSVLVLTLGLYMLGLLLAAVGSRLAGRCTTWCCALLGLPMWVVGGTIAPFCLALPQLMLALLEIAQGMLSSVIAATSEAITDNTLPESILTAVDECSLLPSIGVLAVSLIGMLVIVVLSFMLVITVYGRMFRLYLYTAISPVPLAAFAGEPSQSIGVSFLKSYAAVCLEGVVIALCCVIYSAYAAARPDVSADSSAAMQVLTYIGELTFNMLVLVGLMKGANQVTREMLGL